MGVHPLEGRNFGDVPLNLELKLEVWDSPNSAGVIIDAIRCARLALRPGHRRAAAGPLRLLHEVAAGAVPRRHRPQDGRGVHRMSLGRADPLPRHAGPTEPRFKQVRRGRSRSWMSDFMSRSSDRLRSPGEGPRQTRPTTPGDHHAEVPAPQALPRRPGAAPSRAPDGPVGPRGRGGAHRLPQARQRAARGERRVRRRAGAHAGAHLGALRRPGRRARHHRRPAARDQRSRGGLVHDRRRVARARASSSRPTSPPSPARAGSRCTSGSTSGRSCPRRPRTTDPA